MSQSLPYNFCSYIHLSGRLFSLSDFYDFLISLKVFFLFIYFFFKILRCELQDEAYEQYIYVTKSLRFFYCHHSIWIHLVIGIIFFLFLNILFIWVIRFFLSFDAFYIVKGMVYIFLRLFYCNGEPENIRNKKFSTLTQSHKV